MPLLLDTGVLYALADRRDAWHERAKTYLRTARETLIVPVTVLPEVTYLLQTRLGSAAERSFVRSLMAGELDVEALSHRDLPRVDKLLGQYPDIGFVDATVVSIAERLHVSHIATTDRRHFGAIRPAHADAFQLVP